MKILTYLAFDHDNTFSHRDRWSKPFILFNVQTYLPFSLWSFPGRPIATHRNHGCRMSASLWHGSRSTYSGTSWVAGSHVVVYQCKPKDKTTRCGGKTFIIDIMKLEQLEHLRFEIPRRPWLPMPGIHTRSKVKTRQSQSYKLKKMAKNSNFEILHKTLHATHLLKLLGKMYKYEMDPTRTVGATERTRDAGRMEQWMQLTFPSKNGDWKKRRKKPLQQFDEKTKRKKTHV